MQRAEEWWWSVGVTVELGWCSDSFRPLKPRSRKKRRLRSGLGLRHLRDEPPWSGGGWWSERSLSCWPWRGLERAQAEIEEKEKERVQRYAGILICGNWYMFGNQKQRLKEIQWLACKCRFFPPTEWQVFSLAGCCNCSWEGCAWNSFLRFSKV